MRRLIIHIIPLFVLLGVATTLRAQYYSVNIDWKTAAAMQAAYATGAAAEGFYYEQVKDILDHYTAAEAAAAGIFSSKFLERRALTGAGDLGELRRELVLQEDLSARVCPYHAEGVDGREDDGQKSAERTVLGVVPHEDL